MSPTPDAVPLAGAASGGRTPHTPPSVFVGLTRTEVALVVVTGGFLSVIALSESGAPDVPTGGLVLLALASWLPLWGLGRWPLAVLAVVLGAEIAHVALVPLVAPEQFNALPVAVTTATYAVAVRHDFRTAWAAGGLAAASLLLAGILTRSADGLAANFFGLDLVLGTTAAGAFVRSRRQRLEALEDRAVQAERTREQEARRQVAQERVRMARELHDVVAHHLALVHAQAGVAEYLLRTDPDAAARSLADISGNSLRALDELRSTVGLLREDDGSARTPTPSGEERQPARGLADLPDLLEAHRGGGGTVEVLVHGEPLDLSALVDLAAYRIVQESLTNVRKHAPGAPARIGLGWTPHELSVRVENDRPPGPTSRFPVSSGFGLVGMVERASASGGSLEAGPTATGGYAVTARLPVSGPPVPTPAQEGHRA